MRSIETIILAALVTAAVTFDGGTTLALAQPAGTYQIVLVNMDHGTRHPWTRRTWPDQNRCDAALGNANEMLAKLVDPDPAVTPPELNGSDPQFQESLLALLLRDLQQTGTFPRYSISCELLGAPA